MARFIPTVKLTHDRDLLGIRCPHGEIGSLHPVHCYRMGTKFLIKSIVRTFIKEKKVVIGQHAYVIAH